MKTKSFFLSTMISSCILCFACNQATALESNTLAQCGGRAPQGSNSQPYSGGAMSNMPASAPNNINGKRPCYPASKCMGDPNAINGRNGGGTAPPTGKVLQVESIEKFEGTIQSVNRVNMPSNQTQLQMVLNTNQGDLLVVLGPANYMDQQKIKFQAGDKVTVSGYRVKANGKDIITAAQVQKNGKTLQLLDEKRQPLWGGGIQGGQSYGPRTGMPYGR